MGERFTLERSVHQGCPLAPYLFLFFVEAMAHFLRARTTSLHGMCLPIKDDAELLDSEYEVFCLAARAKINWHKSVGFLTDPGASSQWGIFLGFRWIPRGQTTRYLGFQVGLDTTRLSSSFLS